jgi:single-strand DNA-binding protein
MAGYNRVIMVGNLTKDPELKQLSSDQADGQSRVQFVCRLNLASNRQFKNKKTGTMVQEVCFIDIDVWGPQAETCKNYLQKGRQILVEGRIKLDTWKEADGQTRSRHCIVADKVVFMSTGQGAGAELASMDGFQEDATVRATTAAKSKSTDVNFKDEAPFEDDLPF